MAEVSALLVLGYPASVRSPFAFEVDRSLCVRTRARPHECVRNKVREQKKKKKERKGEREREGERKKYAGKHNNGGGSGEEERRLSFLGTLYPAWH